MNIDNYIVIKPQENCGMCGYIWQTIRAIYHNPNRKYYIDFGNSIYKSKTNDNIWDYFFCQPHTNTKPNRENIDKEVGIIFDAESEFVWADIKPNTTEEIQKRRVVFSEIINKYCVLQPQLKSKVDSFVEKNFKNKKVLGVHFRGTDHPHKKHMAEYLQIIKEKLVNYDVLFVCSDEYERFRLAEVTFSNKVVSYDSLRSNADRTPLHSHPNDMRYTRNDSFEYQYKIAEDVIIESFLMANVDFLVCCAGSNVNFLSRAINPNLNSITL